MTWLLRQRARWHEWRRVRLRRAAQLHHERSEALWARAAAR